MARDRLFESTLHQEANGSSVVQGGVEGHHEKRPQQIDKSATAGSITRNQRPPEGHRVIIHIKEQKYVWLFSHVHKDAAQRSEHLSVDGSHPDEGSGLLWL